MQEMIQMTQMSHSNWSKPAQEIGGHRPTAAVEVQLSNIIEEFS